MRSFARLTFVAGMLYYVDATFYGGVYIKTGLAVTGHVANAIFSALL